ncbi:MAG: alanine racemase [Clostridiales bacterium]|nr:alanine racemase [Clostridiales bacterium]
MRNVAVIDTLQIKSNAMAVKNGLKKGVKFCAVVKADAYGHGAERVANALYKIVDCFAVAIPEEGYALRLSGIDKDILVMTPCFKTDVERCLRAGLTLTVCNMKNAKDVIDECNRLRSSVKVHIKVNTGMNRQGVDTMGELNEILSCLSRCKRVVIDGVYSHLGDVASKKSVKTAYNKFLLALSIVKSYNRKATAHLSASGGYLLGLQLDMVRIGILLYGYKPFVSDKIAIKPVMKVFANVVGGRVLKRGDKALYGDKRANCDQVVTLVRFGYADGLPRKEVEGQFNNRCMDLTAVCGEYAGNYIVMDDATVLAKKYGTIEYEILTKVSQRAEKFYLT